MKLAVLRFMVGLNAGLDTRTKDQSHRPGLEPSLAIVCGPSRHRHLFNARHATATSI